MRRVISRAAHANVYQFSDAKIASIQIYLYRIYNVMYFHSTTRWWMPMPLENVTKFIRLLSSVDARPEHRL